MQGAATRLGVDKEVVYATLRHSPLVRRAREEGRQRLVDLAEEVLDYQLDTKKNLIAAIYTTKTRGKSRGWVETPNYVKSMQVNMIIEVVSQARQRVIARRDQARLADPGGRDEVIDVTPDPAA